MAQAQSGGDDNGQGRIGRIRSTAMRALSDLVGRSRFASKIGSTFGGLRDMECALGYQERLQYSDFLHRYKRGGIAKRLVEAFPDATWTVGPSLVENPAPDVETEFEAEVAELVDRLNVWSRFRRADVLAGIGEYSVLLIGVEGDEALDQPMPQLSGPDSILYLQPVPQDRAEIDAFSTATSDKRFGLPEFYQLTLGSSQSSVGSRSSNTLTSQRVHWSRVIHFADDLVEDDVYGTPKLRPAWNYLDDITKVVGGGSEAAWKRAQPWLQLDMDPEVEMNDADEDAMDEEVDELLHGLRTVFRTRGVKANLLAAAVSSFKGNLDAIMMLVSSTARVPLRLLTGSERGELASTEDRNSWSENVSARRGGTSNDVVRDFIDRLIEHGGVTTPESYSIVWPEIDELNEQEKASVTKVLADANKAQFDSEGRIIVLAEELRDKILGLAPMEDVTDNEIGGAVEQLRLAKRRIQVRRACATRFVDRAPDDPNFRAIHKVADAHVNRIEGVARLMLENAQRLLDVDAVQAAMEARDAVEVERLVSVAVAGAGEAADESMADVLLATLTAGGEQTARIAEAAGSWIAEPTKDVG